MLLKIAGVIVDGSTPVVTTPTAQPIALIQGQDTTLQVAVSGSNGTANNLAGYTALTMTIKAAPAPYAPILQSILGTVVGGLAQFALTGSMLKTLYGGYTFDVFITNPSGSRDEVVPDSPLSVGYAVGA